MFDTLYTWAKINKDTKTKKLRKWASEEFKCQHIDCYWVAESNSNYEMLWCDDCEQYLNAGIK